MSKYHTGNISKWKKVYVHVSSLEVAKDFYVNKLGFHLKNQEDDSLVIGDESNELVEFTKTNEPYKHAEGQYHIAFLLESDQELASWLQHLIKNNVSIHGASHHGVSKAIYLQDPFGNGIEVYSDTEEFSWDRRNDQIRMGTYPLDVNKLLQEAKEFHKLTKVYIGHIHLKVKNIEKMFTFYSQFGLEKTFDIKSALFTSFDGYHHHIAFNTWNMIHSKEFDSSNLGLYQIDMELINNNKVDSNILDKLERNNEIVIKDPIGINIKIQKGEQI